MYDIKWIRENKDAFDEGRRRRGLTPLAERLIALDDERKAAISKSQETQQTANNASKAIGFALKFGDNAQADALKLQVAQIKHSRPQLEKAEREAIAKLEEALAEIPNTPLESVPFGKDEHDNVEVLKWGKPGEFDFTPKEHFEIGEGLAMMDFETAAKLSGARFVVNKGGLARLERALAQFMLDLHTSEHGYTEVSPPLLVKDHAMFGTGQLPKFVDDQFTAARTMSRQELLNEALERFDDEFEKRGGNVKPTQLLNEILENAPTREDFWLIPTAEVALTNLVREQILDEAPLPLRMTADTLCFRAEAGAAGRDTRGMIRQHQFRKVELVSITTADQSHDEHERMVRCAEEVLKRLELPFRTMLLCAGDMGFGAKKTYDLEVWLPSQGKYREISSCSNCGDFQARRMNARFRNKDGKTEFVHTLNGSGLAVGRTLVAVLENYQQADGAIKVPEALVPYMGGVERIAK